MPSSRTPRPRPPASSDHTITCRDYQRAPAGKRCVHYQEGGRCLRPEADHGRCLEWLKLNAPAEVSDEPARDLFGAPIEPDPRRRRTPAGTAPPQHVIPSAPDKPPLVRNITDEEVASFKALGAEVCIRSEALGDVWLVPEYTGALRAELSVEHSVTLTAICAAFPGAKVVAFERKGR